MSTTYRALAPHLCETADAAGEYLRCQFGINQLRIEQEVHEDIDFRPTLHGIAADKHVICAEIVEFLDLSNVERFVLGCRNHLIPAKIFVGFARGQFAQVDLQAIKSARHNGVALLEISPPDRGALVNGAPLSQSVAGLRAFKVSDYPPRFREVLTGAIETFRTGNPVKGCSQVYDELEGLCRRIGKKCAATPGALRTSATFDWDKVAWATLLDFLSANLNAQNVHCPDMKKQLLSRLIGITEYRNEVGHKVSTTAKLMARDRELRTRFENAMDELSRLVQASKPLRV